MINTILESFDIWTLAQTIKSNGRTAGVDNQRLLGIDKLRELILELAVKGKLVPQDEKDEPADVQLGNIIKAKERLIILKESLKSQKDLSKQEMLNKNIFPIGWSLAKLSDITNVINGRAYKKQEMLSSGTPILRVGNLFTSNEWYYSDLKLEPEKYIDNGDLIYAWSASFGPFIWQGGKVIYHYHIWKLDLYDPNMIDKHYLYNYLLSVTKSIKASGNGIAMIHMTKENMEKIIVPLPPLAEQHRIVAKVDELMALCDQLEQQQTESNVTHHQLVELLLQNLTAASGPETFATAWHRIATNFDTLLTTEYSIDQLKQTILQLAVMGKLVPQDPQDEPASELLKKIAKEKERLVKEGKIKKQNLPEIDENEAPFQIPKTWKWVPWGEILAFNDVPFKRGPFGSDLKKDMFVEKGFKVYEQYCPINDDCSFERYYITPEKYEEMGAFAVKANDYLVSCSGVTLGRITQVPENFKEGIINQALLRVRINHNLVDKHFFKLLFRSAYFQKLIFDNSTGSAIPNVKGVKELIIMPVPLFSIREQHRIVAKVDELFALCDALKERIKEAQETQGRLAEGVLG